MLFQLISGIFHQTSLTRFCLATTSATTSRATTNPNCINILWMMGVMLAAFNTTDAGIGLKNITDRVNSLNGNIHISNEKGFIVFISIPKEVFK